MRRMLWCTAGVSLLSFLAAPPASAQKGSLRFGPMAGVSIADFRGADVTGTNSHTSFAAGAFFTYELGRNISIEPQIFYVGKGTEVDIGGGTTGTFRLDYVEIPLLLKGMYPLAGTTRVVPNLFAGPAVGFKATCKLKVSGGGVTAEQSCSAANVPIKSTDFVVVFGGGVDIGPVALQVRYDLGLTKIDDTSPPADVKTQAWIITAGYTLPFGRK